MNTYSEEKIYESYSNEVERMQKYIDELLQENKQLKEVIKRCYTQEEVDFEIMPVKAELEAEKDSNNNLHKTIDKLRVNLYEIQQDKDNLQNRIDKAIELLKEKVKVIPFDENGEGGGLELTDYDIQDLLDILKESGEQ